MPTIRAPQPQPALALDLQPLRVRGREQQKAEQLLPLVSAPRPQQARPRERRAKLRHPKELSSGSGLQGA